MSNEAFEYKSSAHGSQSIKGTVSLDEAQGIVECFVAGIGNKDSVGDVCASGAFTKSLLRRKPRVVWGHNWNDPIGKVLEIYEVGPQDPRLPLKMKLAGIGGLFAKVQFNLSSEKGKEAFANVHFFGEEQEWSIGYKTLRAQFDQKSQANILYEVELYEVSPVLHGANQLTGTISVKADDSAYGGSVAMMPQREESNGYEEMEKELSNLFGAKVSVHSIDGDEVVFTRQEMNGAKKYKCGFMRNQGRYMFGTPEVINIPQSPVRSPQSAPMPVVSGRPTPPNDPQRVIRPQQMPSIPVAIKPSDNGLMMIPLPAVQYDSNEKPSLDKEEADLRDALLKIVSRHGKFNEDSNGVWAGYSPAEENEVARIGVKCSNCVFYQGGSKCKIIDMPVEPEGKCRFAVIPNGIVLSSGSKELEEHVSEAENAIIDVLELKYPGEFVLGIVRNAVGKKKKKRNKYKNLSEFGDDDDMGEKSYVIPVEPSFAFRVKTALDPIFDYHRAETFVDSEGIVITSGVTENLIDAVDTALHNLKKKFSEHEIEGKSLGYRIGRSLGSRLVDRPNLGGGRDRNNRGGGRGFGMPDGDLDPRTRVDKNRDGTLFDNVPGWEQPDPTPDGPGSINNRKLSSSQRRDVANIPSESVNPESVDGDVIKSRKPRYTADDLGEILGEKKKPTKKAVAKKSPVKKEKVKRGELDFAKGPKKDKTPSLSSGEERPPRTAVAMQMDPKNSKLARQIDYDPQNGDLTVYYRDGKKETFNDVPYDRVRKAGFDDKPDALISALQREQKKPQGRISLASGEQEKRLTRHSGDPKFESLVSPEELEKRKKFEEVIKDWKDSGYGWEDVPRYKPDVYKSPDYLRGREMGVNQAKVMWRGDSTVERPKGFNEKQKASLDYQEWYSRMVMRAGAFLEASRGDDNEFYNGMEDAMHEFMYNNRPDITTYNIDGDRKEPMADWMRQYGFDPGSPTPLRKKKEGKKRSSLSLSSGADDDTRPNFDEENYESDTNVDFYDTLLDMMGPEEERPKVTSRKKPKDMSDEEIYRKRTTTGASLQDVAEELGLTRMEVRKREQRHMRKMRNEKDGVSLSSGASDDWATSRGYEPDRFDLRETMNQIGRGNIMAISGGRVERRGNEMILPSTKDQQVVIGYNSVPDLYYVRAEQKINTGKDKGTNRILAQWDEVYADEIGELAYQASLKPANLNSENKEYWKLGKGNQFADRLVDRRSGKLVSRESRNLPSKPAPEESPTLSSGGRGRDYYNYDITTTDEGNGLLDQVHDYLEENPLIKDDITTDIADMLGGDGIVEANGFDTKKAFDLVTGGDDEFQDYMDIVDDAMEALSNGSLAKHKATVRDTNVRLESAKPGSNEAGKLEAIRDRSYEWIGDINKYSRVSTIKDKKNIEASDVATRMISKEQDSLWNARASITEKYIEDIASAGKESKRRVSISAVDTDSRDIPEYDLALSSGSVFKDKPASKTLSGKADGLSLASGENKKIYDEIGKSILEALIEMDKNPTATYWDVPWRTPTLYARNPTKNRLYQGMNSLLLANAHRQNKYRGNFWAGKTQWAKFGGTIKNGKDGVNILVPREGSTGKYFVVQTVYNLDDIEGLPDAYVKKLLDTGKELLDPATKIKDAESVMEEINPVIKFGGDAAYFSITNDHIQMPPYEMFKSPEQYYSTLLHELTHWTGGKSRLGRKQVGRQQDKKAYAYEELIAEMGSSFLLAALGIAPEVRQDHVVYIKSWISNLREDPGAFVRAMTEAQQAADWVMDRSPTMRRLSGVPDSERKGKPDAVDAGESAVSEVVEETKGSVTALSSGSQVGLRKAKELRYFGDEKEYGSGITQRDSSGRILDESGALSLSSGAKPIVSLDGKTTIPRLDDSVSYREKYKFLPDEFEPTEQQKASIDTLVHMLESETPGIVAIGAGAGSGKTTNLKQNARAVAALYPGKQIYYTVFNRGNAKDGNRVMPRNTGVATGNQIAYWSLVLGTGDAFYGAGTTRKIQLGVGPRDSKKLRGAKRNTVNVATTFEGETKEFAGEIPGYRELGYTSYDSAPNIAERLAKDGIVDEETDDGFTISQNLKKALGRFAESSDEKLSKQHFLLRDIEKIQALQNGEPVPTEDSIDEKMVQYAQMLWDETVDPKSNVLIPQDYQIKMWALTNPDLRYDKGLIGHRPNETVFDKVFLGTVEEMNSGKIKVGDLVEFKIPETGEKVAAVIRKLNPPSKKETKKGELSGSRQVTGTVSIVSVTSDKPLDVFMFDEAQDVNPVLAKVLADNAKNMPIIMVGDSRQAIYGFRGAMDALEKANATFRLPLTRSFRYGAIPAYLANVVLMQGNIDDFNFYQNMGTPEKNIWHHVVGEAQNVVINALNINGPDGKILPKKELEKKLKFIEVKYKLGGRAVDFKGKNEKEVKDIISKLYDEHVPRAEGQIVEDMTSADAVLTSTNSGVMVEALKVIQDGINAHQIAYLDLDGIEDIKNPEELAGRLRTLSEKYTLDGVAVDLIEILEKDGRDSMLNAVNELREEYAPGGADGKIPAIGIPADTHEKFLDFFTQLDWIIGDLDKKFGIEGRPKPSKLLKDVWRFDKKKGRYPSKDEMLAKIDKMIKGGESELRTLYNLAYPKSKDGGVRGDAKGARFFKDLLRPQGQKYTDINGTEVKYQGLRPMREGINLPNMESGRDHITTEEMDRVGKLKPGTKSGSSQKISWIIPKKEESVSDGEVFVKLHIGENGKPSGALIIAGDGAHGGKYKVRRWNKAKKTWSPIEEGKPGKIDYHGDISKVIKKMKAEYPDAVIEFRQGLIQQVGTAQTFPSDISDDFVPPMKGDLPDSSVPRASLPGFFIQGKDSEETARLANELGNRVRQLATEGNTDTDIMTVHVSKGREWKRVRLADDFKNPEDMVPVIPEEELAKLSPKDRLAVERQLQLMRREEHNKVYIAITRAQEQIDIGAVLAKLYFDDSQNASIKSAKDKIAENPDGIYDELQAPAGFYVPYSGDTEARDAARKERRKRLDESFDRYVKSQGKTKDVAPEEDDEPEVEDESGGFDSGDPDFVDVAGPDDDGAEEFDEEDGDVQSLSLSSGAKKKKTNRANRRLPFSEQERQSLADGDILRSKKIPKKRKPAPSKEEFDDLALASGANTPEGRYARRLRSISLSSGNNELGAGAQNQRISGKRFARNISGPKDLASIRVDGDPSKDPNAKRKIEYAMSFWRGVRERGIAFDPQDASQDRKSIEINNAISSVSKSMATRPKAKIGKVSQNQIKDDVNPDEWFVPVSKLRDAIRIPTEFSNSPADPSNPNSRMIARWTQTRPLSNEELGKMLSLSKTDIAKLSDDDAGITHDSVRFLLAAMGQQEGFEAWNFFAPTSTTEDGVSAMSTSEKFVENLGRANMRDRFIIETFGKDAFPYWIDKDENTVIGQKEYSSLGEVSEMSKFRSSGLFSNKRNESNFSSTAEEMLLEEAVFGGDDTPSDMVKQSVVEAASAPSDKTSREQFDVDQLLESLGIDKSDKWHEELKRRMVESFGVDDVGLNTREIARNWEAGGVPTTYINEMIRTGMIPDAKSVWKKDESGKKLDQELAASKHSVYEALYEFTQSKHAADKAKNTRRNRDYILNSSDFTVSHKGVAARKGATFSKKTGDERRFSQGELQNVVNRFNEIFGTNYKIDDIFSAEQLRNATKRLREEGRTLYGDDASELGKRVILKKDKDKK